MRARSLLGFSMLGAFWLSASCGSDSKGSGVPGYGLACASDKDCASYDLLCGVEDTCVQCQEESDCETAESCVAGLCLVPQDCEDSRDCSGDQVCNETAGVCVQCLTNRDCPTGQTCAKNSCATKQACEFTSDCEGGLLCDVDAGVCVTCRTDRDCPSRRVCEENECVVESSGGSGGSGGKSSGGSSGSSGSSTGGMGGRNGGSGGGGGGGAGGISGGGMAGISGGGIGGDGGDGGDGGAPSECDCSSSEACTPDLRCVSKQLVDDFVVCDEEILAIEGRSGVWYGEADLDVNITYSFGDPGSQWDDHSCAAWATGGELPDAVDNTFAFIGFTLNDTDPYSLVGNTGLQIKLESSHSVQVVLKTSGGGYFEYILSPLAGSNLRSAPFALMTKMASSAEETLTATNLATVTDIQFSVLDRTTFGLAIHSVTLY